MGTMAAASTTREIPGRKLFLNPSRNLLTLWNKSNPSPQSPTRAQEPHGTRRTAIPSVGSRSCTTLPMLRGLHKLREFASLLRQNPKKSELATEYYYTVCFLLFVMRSSV